MAFETRKSIEKETIEVLLTREEKEALLDQKIQRMKIKNAERMKKFQEIEEDKKWAEREGRAVTLQQHDFSDNEDDSWPKRTDRFEDVDEGHFQQKDLRKVLQQRKTESKVIPELQPNPGRQQNASKYKSLLADGPPPDPGYSYLADRGRDNQCDEKREDNKSRRGFQRRTRGDQHQNEQRANHHGPDRSSQRQVDDSRNDELRANYDHWRTERDGIDRDRIGRQKTKEGWKREWDWDKHENQSQRSDLRLQESVGPQRGVEQAQKTFASSGESHPRGILYRGGRGRGRQRPDMRSDFTPDREVGVNYQKPPRFRNSPDDQRPGNVVKHQSKQGSTNVGPHSIVRSDMDAVGHNMQGGLFQLPGHEQRESSRSGTIPLADVIVNANVKNYKTRDPIVITVGNQGYDGKSEQMARIIHNKEPSGPEISPDLKTKAEFLTHTQFPKSPKKGIGSGRIVPPPKGRQAIHGKDIVRRMVPSKGRRLGSHLSTESDEVTIGIAVITTPGDKDEPATEAIDINRGAEEVSYYDIPAKKEIDAMDNDPKGMNLLESEIEEDDDDDDEWEDVDEGSGEIDDNLKQELNKSNESIHQFIKENTLHPDGTNWNIDVDGDNIPWSEQVDAESQERHLLENDWPKQRPSDSFTDTSFQSSCSIVESPFEQSEVLSSLLAAACHSPQGCNIEPFTSAKDEAKYHLEDQLNDNFALDNCITGNAQETTENPNIGYFQSSDVRQTHDAGIEETESTESLRANEEPLSSPVHTINSFESSKEPLANGMRTDAEVLNDEIVTPNATEPFISVCESLNSSYVKSETKISDSVDQELKPSKPNEDPSSDTRESKVESLESSDVVSDSNPVNEEILPSSDASLTPSESSVLQFSESQQKLSSQATE